MGPQVWVVKIWIQKNHNYNQTKNIFEHFDANLRLLFLRSCPITFLPLIILVWRGQYWEFNNENWKEKGILVNEDDVNGILKKLNYI